METFDKEVRFDKYCKTCEYEKDSPDYDPCNECLCTPVRAGTEKPLNHTKKKGKK